MNYYYPYILDILFSYYSFSNQGKIVKFCWISSHIGKHGNNEADKAVKSALDFEIVKFKIPSTDLKHFIKHYITSLWQIVWDLCDTSKQYIIQNKVIISYRLNLK